VSDAPVRKQLKGWALKVARVAVIAYVGLAIVLALLQTQLIFPGASTQGTADATIDASQLGNGAELVTLATPSREKVVALFGRALDELGRPRADASSRPTLLHFYGNGMCMAYSAAEFEQFRRRGFNVMIPDYLGYGMSGGKPSEENVYATADACFDHLLSRAARGEIDGKKIVPTGWSLGAAAAFHLAATRGKENVPCVVAVSAFTSVDAMARKLFPFLPTGMILRHHFDNAAKIRTIARPVFLAHGTRDGIIPFAMSNQLADAAAGGAAGGAKVTKYDVVGGDHNDVFDVGGRGLLDAIEAFVNEHARANAE
jgi:uncharacterized protein